MKKSADKPIKDCSNCILPHIESGYDYVIQRLQAVNCDAEEHLRKTKKD